MRKDDNYYFSDDDRKGIVTNLFGGNCSIQEEYGTIIAACGYCDNEVVEVCFSNCTVYINKRTNTDKRSKKWFNSAANMILKTKQMDFFSKETFARLNDKAIGMVQREGYNMCVIHFYLEQKKESAA